MKSAKKAVKKAVAKRKADAAKKAARKVVASAPPPPLIRGERLVKIRGFGPITEADIRLRPLTVFAGANGTGKTFACRAIYSFFSAMGENHAEAAFQGVLNLLEDSMDKIKRREAYSQLDTGKSERAIAELEGAAKILRVELSGLSGGDFQTQLHNFEAARPRLAKVCERVCDAYRRAISNVKQTASVGRDGDIDLLCFYVNHLSEIPRKRGETIISDGMRGNALNCLTDNFQALYFPRQWAPFPPDMDVIIMDTMEIEGCGRLYRDDEGGNYFQLPPSSRQQWPGFYRLAFLDSPAYWKLRDVLEKLRFARPVAGRRALDGVPQYFYDLAAQLREKDPSRAIPGVCERLEKIIGGKVVMTESGELRFYEKSEGREVRSFSMHNTAGGKVNLGMLSFLVEQGIIAAKTMVFIDEPESNLHPAWQEEMAETLARLVNEGVYVVVATHSDWMLSTIANIVRRGELGENGEQAALRKEQVGVWLFERGKKKGSVARELRFDSVSGYIPNDLRDLSNALHNETADLLDEMDERERVSAVAERTE